MQILFWNGRQLQRILTVVGILSLLAIVLSMGAAQWVMTKAQDDPQAAKRWLSAQAHAPIEFDGVRSRWTRSGPVLDVSNLRLGNGPDALKLGNGQLMLSMYTGWLPNRSFSQLRLTGLQLQLFRHADGRWELLGLPKSSDQHSDPLDALSRIGELQIVNGGLRIQAPTLNIDTAFPRANVRLRADGERFRGGIQAWSQLSSVPISGAVDFDRTEKSGIVWVASKKAELADWSALLQFGDLHVDQGKGDLSAWLEVKKQRVTAITGSAELRDVTLRNVGPRPGVRQFERLNALGRWTHGADWWSVALPRLQVSSDGQSSDMSRTLLAGGRVQVFNAAQLNGGVLADLAVIVPWLPDRLRGYLQESQARATLRNVRFVRRDGVIKALAGEIRDIHVLPSQGYPGLSGLQAKIKGGEGDWTVALQPAGRTVLSIPESLLQPLTLAPDGNIRIEQLSDRLVFSTQDFKIGVEGYPVSLNGHVEKLESRQLPDFDVVATAKRFPMDKAKLFWVRNKMPSKAIAWLDPAFVSGEIHDLHATFKGNPQDWPLPAGQGLVATGKIVNGQVHFAEGWPDATGLNANARFENDGFTVTGHGTLDRIPVENISVSIDHYQHGTLRIRAGAVTDASAAISLLSKSPIAASDPDTFRNLKLSGPATTGFALDLPMVHDGQMAINGVVNLNGVTATDARYKLTMTQLRGRGIYNRRGFLAENLSGYRDGINSNLAVRVGPGQVRDADNIVEVALASALAPKLIDSYTTSLNWLKPYLSGVANWQVQVNVPSQARGKRPARLTLKSDLIGMGVNLPEPLNKPATQPLATQIEIPLPVESNEIRVSLGRKAGMRILTRGDTPWVRMMLGSDSVAAPVQPGLTVEGSADRISALDWIAVTKSDDKVAGAAANASTGLRLNRIDVMGRNVYLLGSNFRNTRITLSGEPSGAIQIAAQGPQLRGTVAVPANERFPIRGNFDLVHFMDDGLSDQQANPSLASTTLKSVAANVVHNAAVAISNPANIPPLQFNSRRLFVGDIDLGGAQFESIPIANGLKVTRMTTRHAAFGVDGAGQWTQTGSAQQTAINASLTTPNAGAAIAAFGAPGQVEGGKGSIVLNVAWNGGPQDFAIEKLQGTMKIDMREGRIPEVEPGVGRVLGLLSIAELPRRLTLDFRDFFGKGLRFNSITGNVDLNRGLAVARDLKIDAAAALIFIEGSSDLRAERFNQIVTVEPRAGGLLTAIGAVTAGPVGAAVGAVANAILQKPIGEMATKRYRVTGPWTHPETETISAGKP